MSCFPSFDVIYLCNSVTSWDWLVVLIEMHYCEKSGNTTKLWISLSRADYRPIDLTCTRCLCFKWMKTRRDWQISFYSFPDVYFQWRGKRVPPLQIITQLTRVESVSYLAEVEFEFTTWAWVQGHHRNGDQWWQPLLIFIPAVADHSFLLFIYVCKWVAGKKPLPEWQWVVPLPLPITISAVALNSSSGSELKLYLGCTRSTVETSRHLTDIKYYGSR